MDPQGAQLAGGVEELNLDEEPGIAAAVAPSLAQHAPITALLKMVAQAGHRTLVSKSPRTSRFR